MSRPKLREIMVWYIVQIHAQILVWSCTLTVERFGESPPM